ncbi:hypothetical protein CEQ90_20395 [Lewinellaceae bacterium SD302]|nr:hypothetical protein CEQ90_20395 [Lewinellaceae bacterium SD302]
MRNILYFFICLTLLCTCNDEEQDIVIPATEEQEPMPEPEPEIIDSVQVVLVEWPDELNDLIIQDFTARLPGYIWGCVYDRANQDNLLIFSYNILSGQTNVISAPENIGLPNFQVIESGPDGKLYLHSSGIVDNRIAIFDTNNNIWSSIEIPGFINGICVDEVNNNLWVAHKNGVSRYSDNILSTFDENNSILSRVVSGTNNSFFGSLLTVDMSGTLWYANTNVLYTFINGEWSLHPLSPLSDSYIITHIVASESEGVLIKVPNESLQQINSTEEIRNYNSITELIESQRSPINIIGRLSDESIIYSHQDGFSYYDSAGNNVVQVNSTNSILPSGNHAYKISRDSEGDIWIGGNQTLAILPSEW